MPRANAVNESNARERFRQHMNQVLYDPHLPDSYLASAILGAANLEGVPVRFSTSHDAMMSDPYLHSLTQLANALELASGSHNLGHAIDLRQINRYRERIVRGFLSSVQGQARRHENPEMASQLDNVVRSIQQSLLLAVPGQTGEADRLLFRAGGILQNGEPGIFRAGVFQQLSAYELQDLTERARGYIQNHPGEFSLDGLMLSVEGLSLNDIRGAFAAIPTPQFQQIMTRENLYEFLRNAAPSREIQSLELVRQLAARGMPVPRNILNLLSQRAQDNHVSPQMRAEYNDLFHRLLPYDQDVRQSHLNELISQYRSAGTSEEAPQGILNRIRNFGAQRRNQEVSRQAIARAIPYFATYPTDVRVAPGELAAMRELLWSPQAREFGRNAIGRDFLNYLEAVLRVDPSAEAAQNLYRLYILQHLGTRNAATGYSEQTMARVLSATQARPEIVDALMSVLRDRDISPGIGEPVLRTLGRFAGQGQLSDRQTQTLVDSMNHQWLQSHSTLLSEVIAQALNARPTRLTPSQLNQFQELRVRLQSNRSSAGDGAFRGGALSSEDHRNRELERRRMAAVEEILRVAQGGAPQAGVYPEFLFRPPAAVEVDAACDPATVIGEVVNDFERNLRIGSQ